MAEEKENGKGLREIGQHGIYQYRDISIQLNLGDIVVE